MKSDYFFVRHKRSVSEPVSHLFWKRTELSDF